ncbi:hypothetical protein AGMMS49975_05830 [Clostridia bacterium]|nr:hypothetical protein AGMMS49975_05830 [Clostridia bacterium]
MTTYTTQTDKNGKSLYYCITDSKKTKISRTEYETATIEVAQTVESPEEEHFTQKATVDKQGLKSSRWVKVHQQGQANFDEKENVMDITVGDKRCQAEALYTVRSYRKAAHWLLKYLECAKAVNILTQIAEQVETAMLEANREEPEVAVSGENWSCEIERMSQSAFKVKLVWVIDEPKQSQIEEDR